MRNERPLVCNVIIHDAHALVVPIVFLDDLPVEDCRKFEESLYRSVENAHPGVLAKIRDKKTLDDAIQMHGSLGYSEDMPFSTWYRYARSARIADGPDEVHDVVVARDFLLGKLELLV